MATDSASSEMDQPQIYMHSEKAFDYTIFDVKWVPYSAKFVTFGGNPRGLGHAEIYEMNEGALNFVNKIENPKAFKSGTFGASSDTDRSLATIDFEGRLQIWDLEKCENPIFSVKGHGNVINAIDGVGGSSSTIGTPELVTGSKDGSVKVWDPRRKDPVSVMMPGSEESRHDCWTVAFGDAYGPDRRSVCAGYDNGDVKLFDLRNSKVRWESNVKHGICSIEFDRKDIPMNKLVVTSLEAKIHVYDMRTHHSKKGFASLTKVAHKSTVWTARHLPQNRDVFMTSGGNGSLCLWKYNYPDVRFCDADDGKPQGKVGNLTKLQTISITSQPITGFDWNIHMQGLAVTSSFDQTVRTIIVTKLFTV